jgi:hypothetical protein
MRTLRKCKLCISNKGTNELCVCIIIDLSSLWKKCVSANTEAETQTRKKLQIQWRFDHGCVSAPWEPAETQFVPETHFFRRLVIEHCEQKYSVMYIVAGGVTCPCPWSIYYGILSQCSGGGRALTVSCCTLRFSTMVYSPRSQYLPRRAVLLPGCCRGNCT